jgi:hypothetical protein
MSNGTQPPASLPPGPDGKCPEGYLLSNVDGQCYYVQNPIQLTSTGVALPDVDPKNAAELSGLGLQNSSLPERWALAHWHTIRRLGQPPASNFVPEPPKGRGWIGDQIVWAIQEVINLYDWAVSVGAGFIGDSATRNNPGFWKLIGALISDLLGVTLDGQALYQQLSTRGTLTAMQDVGASLVNLLVGEFTGTASGSGGQINFSSTVNPDTNLPEATLTPAGGVKAAQALMGFVLSSAVREGNIEAIATELGWIGGHVEKFSEAMRTNLGIGRMLRFALRPIFQDLVATPLKWAVSKQYRTKLLNTAEAARAFLGGYYKQEDFLNETALDGLSDARAFALLDQHTRKPDPKELLTLRAAMALTDTDLATLLGKLGFDKFGQSLLLQASDLEPARRVALALAEHYLLEFGKGSLTTQALKDFVDGLKGLGFLLTPGEVTAIESVSTVLVANVKLHPKHLSTGQLKQAYIDGTITLDEYEQHLTDMGYNPADVQTLGIEVLIAAQKAAAAAAKHAAAGKKGSGPKPTTTTPPAAPTVP